MMVEQIHEQSHAEASPPLALLGQAGPQQRHGKLERRACQYWWELAGCRGLRAGLGGWCHVGAGQTGSSCWEVRGGGFVCKGGHGGGRLGRPRGEADNPPCLPPPPG